jgi:hypothetical protein
MERGDEDRHVMIDVIFIGPQVGDLLHAATIAIVGQVLARHTTVSYCE